MDLVLRLKSTEIESVPFVLLPTGGVSHFVRVKCLEDCPETVTVEYREKGTSKWNIETKLTKGRNYNDEKGDNRIYSSPNAEYRITVDRIGAEVYTTHVIGRGNIESEIRKSEKI